jgi:APA family basic amino acid/polyamine antiporter
MPRAGGQYVYLREAFGPLCGFLYGWTLFLVIQTGTIAAVAVGFAKYLGTFFPAVSQSRYLIAPVSLGGGYALSLSTAQCAAIALVLGLTALHTRGIEGGKWVQNAFTAAKSLALVLLVGASFVFALRRGACGDASPWKTNLDAFIASAAAEPPLKFGLDVGSAVGLGVAVLVAQTNSLFSSDAWNNVTFVAGEVKRPAYTLPRALALGTVSVTVLYLLCNVGYLAVLPFESLAHAPEDRVAVAAAQVLLPAGGAEWMAGAILVSIFGCESGLVLAGARAFYAMARDGLFFRGAATLNPQRVPATALWVQAAWSSALVLPRTERTSADGSVSYGSLYNDLLAYVMATALLFYVLCMFAIVRLRRTRPDLPRPYRAWGYPFVPMAYAAGAILLVGVLTVFLPATTLPGAVLVLSGLPVYGWWSRSRVPR